MSLEAITVSGLDLSERRYPHDTYAQSDAENLSNFIPPDEGQSDSFREHDLAPATAGDEEETPSALENGLMSRPTPAARRPPPVRRATQRDLSVFFGEPAASSEESVASLTRRNRPGRQAVSFVSDT
jgi:hypothetical protein